MPARRRPIKLRMESRVVTQLFERTNGGTTPTVAGREFLLSARHILAGTETAMRRLQSRSRGENERILHAKLGS